MGNVVVAMGRKSFRTMKKTTHYYMIYAVKWWHFGAHTRCIDDITVQYIFILLSEVVLG